MGDLMTNVSSSMLAWSVSAASFATCPILNHDLTQEELLPAIKVFTDLWRASTCTGCQNVAVSSDSTEALHILRVLSHLGLARRVNASASVSEWCLTPSALESVQSVIEVHTGVNPFAPVLDRSVEEMTIIDLLEKLR